MAQQTTANESSEQKELADRHESVGVKSEHIQATFEYTIDIPDEKIEELPDTQSAEDFACSLACSRATKEYDLTFSVHDAVAQEERQIVPDERVFTVLVRVSQNR